MSGARPRQTRDHVLGDHAKRIRVLERVRHGIADDGWPTFYQIPLAVIDGDHWDTNLGVTDPLVIDNRHANNARLAMGGSDGAYFTVHLRLGPKGSIWSVSARYTKGADHGKLYFDWATPSEDIPADDYPLPAGFDGDGTGAMQAAASDGLTYVRYQGSGVSEDFIDGYAAVPELNALTAGVGEFRITGEPGDPLTDFAPTGNFVGLRSTADGGPGLWNFRPIIDGKNASSSGYEFGLIELLVRREDWKGF